MSGNMRWLNESIRVEHIVSPGGWFTPEGKHLRTCQCRCADVQTCPQCGLPSRPSEIAGRWDAEGGHTARPFDPVWVKLSCGCMWGDYSLSRPAPFQPKHKKFVISDVIGGGPQ